MKDSIQLEPTGVAHQLFAAANRPQTARSAQSSAQQDAAFLLAATEDRDLSPSIAYLASELVGLQPELDAKESRALLCLVLISLFNQRQGSTYLPLNTDESPILLDSLTELIPKKLIKEHKGWAPDQILTDIHNLLANNRAPSVIGQPADFKPLIVSGQHLYHQRMLHNETHLVEILAKRLEQPFRTLDSSPDLRTIRTALDDILAHAPQRADGQAMTLNTEQQYGVLTALHAPLSIITGGPGTGKTSIVVSILRMLARLNVPVESIALAAPTGKAANRLGESVLSQIVSIDPTQPHKADLALRDGLQKPTTLHRLLGYSPSTESFQHHVNNPLEAQFAIVDEASMIDLFMMKRLVSAIAPHANLILLGDSEQLPSVDTGAVLRDLLPQFTCSNTPWRAILDPDSIDQLLANEVNVSRETFLEPLAQHSVRLTTSYRMDTKHAAGRKIHTFAGALNDPTRSTPLLDLQDPTDQQLLITQRATAKQLEHTAVELFHPNADASLSSFVDHWFTTRLANIPDFDTLTRNSYFHDGTTFDQASTQRLTTLHEHLITARVLTLTRVHTTGSARINAAFHTRFLQTRTDDAAWDYVAGEPIMMLHNDYERGLFNGDQGIVLWIRRHDTDKSELAAVFLRDDQFVPYNLTALRSNIEHAFAMTVHKAQGSEFKHVALILPTHDVPLLTREILYTAVSRASVSVTIVGDPTLLETGAHRTTQRFSGITQKLAEILPPKTAPKTQEARLPPSEVIETKQESTATPRATPKKPPTKKPTPKSPPKPTQGSLFSFDDE